MKSPSPGSATTIFMVFFGVSLLDAASGGNAYSVLFWLAAGALFTYVDLRHLRRPRVNR
jgi:hypothetical protein